MRLFLVLITQHLSSFLKPDVENVLTQTQFSAVFFECLLDSPLLSRYSLLTLTGLLLYMREISEQGVTDFSCLPFLIWFWNIVLYCSLTVCLGFFSSQAIENSTSVSDHKVIVLLCKCPLLLVS